MSAAEWEGILREGETVLWQGQPDPAFHLDPSRRLAIGAGVFISVVGLAMFAVTLRDGDTSDISFAAFFLGLGLLFTLKQSWWPNFKRRHSFYTLTNQRAILGIALPGLVRRLKVFEIEPDGDYELRAGTPGSVIFAFEDEGVKLNDVKQYFAAGFLRISEAEKVWAMVQELQNDMRNSTGGRPGGVTR
ncbi:MAG: hypothetical protein KDK10_04160 [Maritimibacter sp.]|nr:hypothetical protein [Maritimibacter sp.]